MSPREWLGVFGKRFGGPIKAGFDFLNADPNQSPANRAGDAAASYMGWAAGAKAGAGAGAFVAGPPGAVVGGIGGGLLGSEGATFAMDALQEGVKNLPAPRSGGLLGLNEPLINKKAAQKFDSNRTSAPTNPRSAPPPSLNPEVPQTGTQTGGSNIYVGMSKQEIKDAYDRLRYGDNFDKARDYMNKGQSDPFDSTYNPNKFLVNDAGQKKAVEEGRKMHEAFFAPGGGSSREVRSPMSPSSARGSGMRNEGSATKEKPFGINFSGPLQNNTRGSNSFEKGKEPVRGMPTYEDHRKRQQSLRNVQKRLQQHPPVNSARPADTPSLDFQSVYNMARNSGAKFPELVAAQFQLESGGGTSELAQKHHNLFGQKGNGVNYKTLEDGSNGMYAIKDDFMVFNNPQESVNYLVDRWYKDYNQYKGVNNASSSYQAAQMLANQGYATDRNYTNKLINILRQQGY